MNSICISTPYRKLLHQHPNIRPTTWPALCNIFFLGLNVFVGTQNACNLRSSLNLRDYALHPYERKGKMAILLLCLSWSSAFWKAYGMVTIFNLISRHHRFQNGPGVHSISYQMDTGVIPRSKSAGTWSWPLTSI